MNDKTIRPGSEQVIKSGIEDSKTIRGTPGVISSGVKSSFIQPSVGTELILGGECYPILKFLAASGEAEVFLAEKNGQKLVVKLYYASFAPKEEVLEKLKSVKHPDIIELLDYGYYQNRFYEVMKYAEGGSLYDVLPIKDVNLLKEVVEEVVNALNYCHEHGIIHRDIKPQNIFFQKLGNKDVAIGDFGISSALHEGFSKRLTKQARTTVYAAPEVFQNVEGKTIIGREVDYYSLGITLVHLWSGREPFEGMGEYAIMRAKIDGNVEIPDDLPTDFKHLVRGLITIEPAKRWGYEEVQRWLRGESVEVHYETYKPQYEKFLFGTIQGEQLLVSNPIDMAELMDKYPEIGIKHLYKKGLSQWVKNNPGLYSQLESIVEDEYPRDHTAGLIKAIYVLDPERPFKGIDGKRYSSGEEIAECLERNFSHYEKDLCNANAPFYLFLEARGYEQEANRFRKLFKDVKPKAALNAVILLMQGGDTFVTGKYRIHRPEELLNVDNDTKLQLIKDLADTESKLSIWIQAFPELKDSIDKWRSLGRFDERTFRYAIGAGVEWQGEAAKDPDQLKQLLAKHPEHFDYQEANYWLNNYMNASLNELILGLLSSNEFTDDELLTLTSYILNNYEDKKLNIFESLEFILKLIDK